jgi:hypothetical protein
VILSHFPLFFSIFAIFQILPCAFLIFHFFQCPSPYFNSYSVCFFIFNDSQFSCITPGPKVCISYFPCFWEFFAIFQVLQCFSLIFHALQFSCHIPYFLPYSRCISNFSGFSIFLAIFYFLQCVYLVFHDFLFSCHISGPTVCISLLSHFSVFLPYSRSNSVFCLCFQFFLVFSPYSRSYSVHFSFSTHFSVPSEE